MTYRNQFWLVGIFTFLLTSQSSQSVAQEERSITLLPDSLSQWYKPVNKRQVWLHTMFALRRELQAIDEYAAEQDLALTRKWSDKFVKHFRKLPEMVPEWRDEVELDEATQLETAARSGDFKTVTSAVSRLQRNCRNCHREYRALAALRYRSPDFSGIEIADEQGDLKDYDTHMDSLSKTVNRIKIASEDNRWARAVKASQDLREQLHRLSESCESCHKDELPRQRILGDASNRTLDELDEALTRQQLKSTGRKLGEAAVIICARCHGVHRTLGDTRSFLFD
ncbi:MAG: cytochrome c [Candidatus Thiodiazotropha sp. (ex Myrtea sp. 'scaly one' KF741663)]|nr:cytochrome c [Candidatus Thiodiazotropha sp. (ex Myrtea sp. 'scaly one' KF741663)]